MMLHHIQAHLRAHPDHVIMQLDLRNAFGTLRRETCIAQLAAALGGMPAWLGAMCSRNPWWWPTRSAGRPCTRTTAFRKAIR